MKGHGVRSERRHKNSNKLIFIACPAQDGAATWNIGRFNKIGKQYFAKASPRFWEILKKKYKIVVNIQKTGAEGENQYLLYFPKKRRNYASLS